MKKTPKLKLISLLTLGIATLAVFVSVKGLQQNQDPRSRADNATHTQGETIEVPITFTATEGVYALDFQISVTNGALITVTCHEDDDYKIVQSTDNSCVIFNSNGPTTGTVATVTVQATQVGELRIIPTGQVSNGSGSPAANHSLKGGVFTINSPPLSHTPSPSLAASPTEIPTITPTPSPRPGTPISTHTPTPPQNNHVTISFKLKLEGVNKSQQGRSVRMTLKPKFNDTSLNQTREVNVTINPTDKYSTGIYQGSITFNNFVYGTYDIYLKTNSHLQKNIENIPIHQQNMVLDWATQTQELQAGDVTGDNYIRLNDITTIISLYTQLNTPVPVNTPQDVDFSGTITIRDIALVISNYTRLTVPGDFVEY